LHSNESGVAEYYVGIVEGEKFAFGYSANRFPAPPKRTFGIS
jgi:hypothetical protein